MPDMEKVIKGLECCLEKQNCKECPFFCFNAKCQDDMNRDALALLKEQGKRKFLIDEQGNITPLPEIVRCKDCKWNSGTAEKPICMMRSVPSPADWFCADGEQKK